MIQKISYVNDFRGAVQNHLEAYDNFSNIIHKLLDAADQSEYTAHVLHNIASLYKKIEEHTRKIAFQKSADLNGQYSGNFSDDELLEAEKLSEKVNQRISALKEGITKHFLKVIQHIDIEHIWAHHKSYYTKIANIQNIDELSEKDIFRELDLKQHSDIISYDDIQNNILDKLTLGTHFNINNFEQNNVYYLSSANKLQGSLQEYITRNHDHLPVDDVGVKEVINIMQELEVEQDIIINYY